MNKLLSLLLITMTLTVVTEGNVLVDPGFETLPLGLVPDGGDIGVWASWPGDTGVCNYNVVNTLAYTGFQSIKIGGNPDDYTNIRQSYKPAGGYSVINSKNWGFGFWVYYDSTEDNNDPATDVFYVQLAATSNWNVVHYDAWIEVKGSQLVDGQWNYVCGNLSVGGGLDLSLYTPGTEEYENRVMNRLSVAFHRWANVSPVQTGTFYIDDVEVIEGGLSPFDPLPAMGAEIAAIDATDPLPLSWVLPDPNNPSAPQLVDVVLTTDPDPANWVPGTNMWQLLDDAPDASSANATPIYLDTDYYWQVTVTNTVGVYADPNGITRSDLFDFTVLAANPAPVVDAGPDVTIGLANGFVSLSMAASVTDNGSTLNSWTLTAKDPADLPDPVIAQPDALNTSVTFTEPGSYTLTLTADDGEKTGSDSVTVTVAVELPSTLADSGFETTPLGIIPDGGAVNIWASWNENFEVTDQVVRNGSHAVKIGAKDLVNASGDKYSNLRSEYEAINPSEEFDDSTWVVSAWVYYDAAGGTANDAFDLRIIARDIWNTATVSSRITVFGSNLVSGQWNFIQTSVEIPEQVLDPADLNYENKRRKLIGIQFEQNGWTGQTGVFYVDDASLASLDPWHWFDPSPADGETVEPINPVTLSWINPSPENPTDSIVVDLYISDSNELTDFDLVAEKESISSKDVTVAPLTTYYWQIVTYDTGLTYTDPNGALAYDPNGMTASSIYSFTTLTGNMTPDVNAGSDVLTYLTNGSVSLTMAGTVTDESSTINAWSFSKNPPEIADPLIQPENAMNATVTFTEAGTYTLTLTADDGERVGSDSMNVIVGQDACDAAKRHPDGYTPFPGDVDGDCRVSLPDVIVMASEWLETNSLTETMVLP